MITIKETAVFLRLDGPLTELTRLDELTRYQPPEYWRSNAYELFKQSGGRFGWNGFISLIDIVKNTGICQRGHLEFIIESAGNDGIELNLSGLLKSPFAGITPEDIPPDIIKAKFQLDDNQRRCVASWLHYAMGVNKATVSAGKTAMFAAVAAMIKRRFNSARILYITPTERLVNQVVTEVRNFLPDLVISQFGGGKKDPTGSDMVVATAAMCNSNFEELLEEKWFRSFSAVFVDESHHAQSKSYQKILEATTAFFRFGASDTTKENDVVATAKIRGVLGPIRNRIEAAPLIRIGRIAKPTLLVVDMPNWKKRFAHLDHEAKPDTPAWAFIDNEWKKGVYTGPVYVSATPDPQTGRYKEGEEDGVKKDKKGEPIIVPNFHAINIDGLDYEIQSRWCLLSRVNDMAIILFKDRNELIAEWVRHFSGKKRPTLVVATRTLHILILQSYIEKVVDPEKVRILFSTHSTEERNETFEWFKSTPGSVLITPLVKEGVSLPELASGVIADHIVNPEVANQVVGRFIRKKPKGRNEAEIITFIDRQHPRLQRNGVALMTAMEKIRGYSFRWPVTTPNSIEQSSLYEAVDAI